MTLDHPLNCLTFNAQRAARSLVRGFEEAARGAGLTAPQFTTLSLLSGYGERAVTSLAEDMGTDRTTLTRNLDVMARKGWIEVAGAEDRRLHLWRLTEAGREKLNAAMPAWRAWQETLVAKLGDENARNLLASLRRL